MKQILFFLFILTLLIASSCNKDGCFHGIVIDSKTGEPVESARVTLKYGYTELGSLKYREVVVYSNAKGEFSYSATEKNVQSKTILEVSHALYSLVFDSEWPTDECGDVLVYLKPLDGLVKLTIFNATGTYDSIYTELFSKCQYLYYHYSGILGPKSYPLTLQPGERYTEAFKTCAGDSSAVMWKFSKNDPWFEVDSALVKEGGDTTFFEITY